MHTHRASSCEEKRTALHCAAASGSEGPCQALLRAGADVEERLEEEDAKEEAADEKKEAEVTPREDKKEEKMEEEEMKLWAAVMIARADKAMLSRVLRRIAAGD
ncbi:ANK1 [Symbiodinium natans]|uniref:ANK1 protein n=1 Tax=Symbiodinium natans TaxID=878477 RepID=A0A812U190_9DINO|nr:ANK1 [Symbiodinium natans]